MRSDPRDFELITATNLADALRLVASGHTPIAGGTELMVAFNTGRLPQKPLISLHNIPELRFIRENDTVLEIGAGATFTDIRNHGGIAEHLPMLITSAAWTGTIANQNRATLGGNICNGSPAADTPPALLAYGASVTVVRLDGNTLAYRMLAYADFHTGYKRSVLQQDELLYSLTLPKRCATHRHFIRKVGTRNALAISKTALAAVASLDAHKTITTIRLGAASLADRPLLLSGTETVLTGRSLSATTLHDTIRAGRAALAQEARPIDDIRSTAEYRTAVAQNLLEEFLLQLAAD